ncbi:MAG: NAD-dependent epimerase/dehydratase family protein [Bacteroidota bacterium]
MKVCVFGGAGFIGSRVVKCLLSYSHQVTTLVRNQEKGAKLAGLGVTVKVGNLKNREDVRSAMVGSDVVINLTVPNYLGRITLGRVHKMAEEFMRNVRNVVEEAQRVGNIPVILSEGTPIWGDSCDSWHDETSKFNPIDMGRIGELSTPYIMHMIEKGTPIIRIISGLTYGAGSWFEHVVYKLMKKGLFRTYGNGKNIYSLVYVDDVAEAYRLAVEKKPLGESFAIVDDYPVKFKDFCNYVAHMMGKPPVKQMPIWLGRIFSGQVVVEELTMNCRVRNTKAKTQLGWNPKYPTYKEGIPAALAEIQMT